MGQDRDASLPHRTCLNRELFGTISLRKETIRHAKTHHRPTYGVRNLLGLGGSLLATGLSSGQDGSKPQKRPRVLPTFTNSDFYDSQGKFSEQAARKAVHGPVSLFPLPGQRDAPQEPIRHRFRPRPFHGSGPGLLRLGER